MAKKKKVTTHKVVSPRNKRTQLTEEMYAWLTERGYKDGECIVWHSPVLVECVETLKPDEFRINEIEGNEYALLNTLNDTILIVPSDLEYIKKSFITIEDE